MLHQTELPRFTILDIIQCKRQDFSIRTQNKACYVISCRTEGESLFFYNQTERTVKRGDVLYIPMGSSYSQACKREALICFHLAISGHASPDIEVIASDDPDRMCALFQRAVSLWKSKPQGYEYLCMSVLYEILALIHVGICEEQGSSPSVLKPAMQYLHAHLYDVNLSLPRVCEQAHISRTYFNRLFREAYGCTPVTYINKLRIDRAKQFVLNGNYTNAEIAELCGFHDLKYFYTTFKKYTSFTTGEYKKANGI